MFLPINKSELVDKYNVDFVLISSDAYVDHPTFGHAVIARMIEAQGFSIGIISQPVKDEDYLVFPEPKYGFLVSSGVVDSMVNNYTVAKKKRSDDEYSPYNKAGRRPDRALIVYTKNLKRLFPNSPVVIGGIEASLRRFAHYDYWSDKVMPSILIDSGADLLIYGMGEKPILDISEQIKKGIPLNKIKNVRGTAYIAKAEEIEKLVTKGAKPIESFQEVSTDKKKYAKAFRTQARNTDPMNADVIFQKQEKNKFLVQNLPQLPMTVEEMDATFALPYERTWHPSYDECGGIKALEEVKFSVTSHRGCFGSCAFCALNYHQGRRIQKRSAKSILDECEALTHDKEFKGYIHDIGGATANFRNPSCDIQEKCGVCKDRYCIGNKPCPNLKVDHTEYLDILRKAREIKGVKKVFIRSGVRFDYVMYDKSDEFLEELIKHHVSGQLKVAPEHTSNKVLRLMNKPSFEVYKNFTEKYYRINRKYNLNQYLVPYLISSHPGCSVKEAVELTEYLKSIGYMPKQVQDFYPTPSTRATCMFYTGIDPDTMEEVYVAKTYEEKKIQRALLQYRKPENKDLVESAYRLINQSKKRTAKNETSHTKSKGNKSRRK